MGEVIKPLDPKIKRKERVKPKQDKEENVSITMESSEKLDNAKPLEQVETPTDKIKPKKSEIDRKQSITMEQAEKVEVAKNLEAKHKPKEKIKAKKLRNEKTSLTSETAEKLDVTKPLDTISDEPKEQILPKTVEGDQAI